MRIMIILAGHCLLAGGRYFEPCSAVGKALLFSPPPLPTSPLTCLPSAPQQAANGRFVQVIKTSIDLAFIDIFCILQGCISLQIAFVKRVSRQA